MISMKKIILPLTLALTASFSFGQDLKPCGQLPVINPTEKAICNNNVAEILNENIPESFKKGESYHASFKIILDCNGIIDFVVYKKGNLTTEQQKYFLTQINKLKDWKVAKNKGVEVSSNIYITIDVENRKATYQFYN